MKLTRRKQTLTLVIFAILFLTGICYENSLLLMLGTTVYGVYIGCETKEVRGS